MRLRCDVFCGLTQFYTAPSCYDVGAPVYGATSLSVSITLCSEGLSRGAIIGIAVGVVVFGLLIAVAIVALTVHIRKARTQQLRVELREKHMADMRKDFTAK